MIKFSCLDLMLQQSYGVLAIVTSHIQDSPQYVEIHCMAMVTRILFKTCLNMLKYITWPLSLEYYSRLVSMCCNTLHGHCHSNIIQDLSQYVEIHYMAIVTRILFKTCLNMLKYITGTTFLKVLGSVRIKFDVWINAVPKSSYCIRFFPFR